MKEKATKIYPSQNLEKLLVRFPDGLKQRIAQNAKNSGRSMNAEVVHLIHIGLAAANGATQNEQAILQRLSSMENAIHAVMQGYDELKLQIGEQEQSANAIMEKYKTDTVKDYSS